MRIIKPIPYYKTIPFHKAGKRVDLIFHENTNYIGYYIKKELVGISGYEVLKTKAILRSAYVLPLYRRQGIYDEFIIYTKHILSKKNINIIEATCTADSLYYHLFRGAKIIKQFKNFTKIRYTL
tara:strand:- start:582 stop:953 length:372 start_codon:yes stop_codon:yes gene_type:complete